MIDTTGRGVSGLPTCLDVLGNTVPTVCSYWASTLPDGECLVVHRQGGERAERVVHEDEMRDDPWGSVVEPWIRALHGEAVVPA